MRERFDDIFRRNLVELDAPTVNEKKRQIKRAYKFRDRKGGLNKTVSEKMAKSNKIAKQKNDEKSSNKWMNSDMILIWAVIIVIELCVLICLRKCSSFISSLLF